MNNSNTPGFIVAGAVNHLRRWCVCKENIITGSMTLRRSPVIIIIVRKSGQISCVPILCYTYDIYYDRNVVFLYNILFGNVFYVCLIFAVYIYSICIYLFFQDVLNRRLEERTDEMVERGLVDELCQFKKELSKMTGTDK